MFAEHKRYVRFSTVGLVLLMVLALGASRLVGAQSGQPPTGQSVTATTGPNLLANPNFDEGGFYFRMPNSLVPPRWYRWDVTPGATIPEFIDGGTAYHNACYPQPAPGALCVDMLPKNRSMGYIKYGGNYIAGGWQPVQVTPCRDYQFSGYVRTDGQNYHPKVGIDQTGWKLPERPGDYGCPAPNGQCYKDHFKYESDMPASIVWSAPFTYDPPTPPVIWRGPITVTAEALSTTITVWTYAAPEPGSQSTYWDSMSLYQVPRQTPLAPEGVVLAPDLLLNPTVTTGPTIQIQWTTDRLAFSQVFYRPHSTSTISATASLTYTTYFPLVPRAGTIRVSDFAYHTELTSEPATSHSVSISGLAAGTTYDYMVAVRWFDGLTCASVGSSIGTFTTP